MTTPVNPYQTSGNWPGPDPLSTEHGVTGPDYRDYYPESDPEGSSLGYQHPGATVPLTPSRDIDETEPIPVRVVSSEQPTQTRRRMSTSTIPLPLPAALIGNQTRTVRIVSQRPNRTKLKIVVKNFTGNAGTAGRVWVSPDEYPSPQTGYPLDYGESLDSNTTDDLWATLDPAATADALICIYEEWETEMPVHSHGTGKHHL